MTTLLDVLANPPTDLHNYGLLFDEAGNAELRAVQATMPNGQHQVSPVATTDSRWLLNADVLTEINGGIFAVGFALLPTNLFGTVDVLPWVECLPLIPVSEPE